MGAFFAFDSDEYFLDKTCFMLISGKAKFLQQILSCKLFEVAYRKIFSSVELGEHGYQYNKHALIFCPNIDQDELLLQDNPHMNTFQLTTDTLYPVPEICQENEAWQVCHCQ